MKYIYYLSFILIAGVYSARIPRFTCFRCENVDFDENYSISNTDVENNPSESEEDKNSDNSATSRLYEDSVRIETNSSVNPFELNKNTNLLDIVLASDAFSNSSTSDIFNLNEVSREFRQASRTAFNKTMQFKFAKDQMRAKCDTNVFQAVFRDLDIEFESFEDIDLEQNFISEDCWSALLDYCTSKQFVGLIRFTAIDANQFVRKFLLTCPVALQVNTIVLHRLISDQKISATLTTLEITFDVDDLKLDSISSIQLSSLRFLSLRWHRLINSMTILERKFINSMNFSSVKIFNSHNIPDRSIVLMILKKFPQLISFSLNMVNLNGFQVDLHVLNAISTGLESLTLQGNNFDSALSRHVESFLNDKGRLLKQLSLKFYLSSALPINIPTTLESLTLLIPNFDNKVDFMSVVGNRTLKTFRVSTYLAELAFRSCLYNLETIGISYYPILNFVRTDLADIDFSSALFKKARNIELERLILTGTQINDLLSNSHDSISLVDCDISSQHEINLPINLGNLDLSIMQYHRTDGHIEQLIIWIMSESPSLRSLTWIDMILNLDLKYPQNYLLEDLISSIPESISNIDIIFNSKRKTRLYNRLCDLYELKFGYNTRTKHFIGF